MIKEPVWRPEVPWYFFTGGLTGASCALAFAAGLARNRVLARRSWLIALAAGGASPALLIADLGRPERFLNMLRVFKPTSPISVGSWLLLLTGSAAGAAAMNDVSGAFPRLGRAGRPLAALFGLPLSTYTAVLVSNTAVPVWHEARRELPFMFAGSAAASAGAAALILTPARRARPARRLALAGAVLASIAAELMERRLGELGAPYRRGEAGRYARLARACTLAGAALMGMAGDGRAPASGGGVALLAGSALERWAVFEAGFASARDPRYTAGPQRRRAAERRAALP